MRGQDNAWQTLHVGRGEGQRWAPGPSRGFTGSVGTPPFVGSLRVSGLPRPSWILRVSWAPRPSWGLTGSVSPPRPSWGLSGSVGSPHPSRGLSGSVGSPPAIPGVSGLVRALRLFTPKVILKFKEIQNTGQELSLYLDLSLLSKSLPVSVINGIGQHHRQPLKTVCLPSAQPP